MFPVGESNCFARKTGFGATAAIKQQQRLCRILGGAALVAAGGGEAMVLQLLRWRKWVNTEEDELRDSEAVDKVRETGGRGVIIGDIF